MNAKEARKRAKEINSVRIKKQAADIYNQIEIAVEGGKYEVFLSQSLMGAVITKLKGDGYILSSSNDRNEDNWIIKW